MTLNETMRRAQAAFNRGDWAVAEQLCQTVLNIRSDFVEALSLLGILKAQTRRPEEAADLLRRVVDALPINPVAHNNYGNILCALGRHEAALGSYDRAIKLKPDYAEAYNSRGNVFRDLKRFDAALLNYDRAVALQPNYADAHYNRGVTLHVLDRLEDALESYGRAIAANPRFADAHYNLGMALSALRRLDEALRSYSRALEFKPRFAEALNNRGNALQDLGRYDEALNSFQQALEIKPDLAEAHYNRGRALQHLKRLDVALSSYESALKINPGLDWLYGAWLYVKMQLCDWNDIGAQAALLLHKISQGQRAARPFTVLALTDDPRLQRQAAQLSAQENESPTRLPALNHKRSDRIRIGYYSADFHNHATAYLAAGLFESHDRARFEIVGFSFGPDVRDAMRARLAPAFDQFLDVRTLSDAEISRKSRNMGIDIAVDLKGFSQDARPGIFALRAAPIQVSYLGYPGTMGAQYIDYIVADETLIPKDSRQHYAEKVVYLPDSYQVNDRKRHIAELGSSRVELGLPADGFVYCCFNSPYKINPASFDCWMRILERTGDSVLWLLGGNDTAVNHLRSEARVRNLDPARLIFAPPVPLAEHLSRLRAADLVLDTLPFNAHTTASDALWAGVPVVTRIGRSFAARVAASLLNGIGLSEFITATEEEYLAMAVNLANDADLMAQAKDKLRENRLTTPLFDTELFTRHIEEAYATMYERHHSGLSPDDIHVSSRRSAAHGAA